MSGWESSDKRMSHLHNNVVSKVLDAESREMVLVTRTKLDFTLSTFIEIVPVSE